MMAKIQNPSKECGSEHNSESEQTVSICLYLLDYSNLISVSLEFIDLYPAASLFWSIQIAI